MMANEGREMEWLGLGLCQASALKREWPCILVFAMRNGRARRLRGVWDVVG